MTTQTKSPWTSVLLMGGGLAAGAALIFGLVPGVLPGFPGRSQSKVYELTVNYQNIPGGIHIKYTRDGLTTGGFLAGRSGALQPPVYLKVASGAVTLDAFVDQPSEGGSAVGAYSLIATITLYQGGNIINVWESSATVRNQPVLASTANPPTG